MAKKLSTEDIVEKGLFKESIEETREFLKVVKELQKEVKELGDDLAKSVGKKSSLSDSDEVDKLRKEMEELKVVTAELQKIEKQELKLKAKLVALQKDEAKAVEALKIEISEQRKELKQSIKEDRLKEGSIAKLRIELSRAKKSYAQLSKEERENTKLGKDLRQSIKAQTDELKSLEEQIGVTSRNVGNYKESVKEALKESGFFADGLKDSIDSSGHLSSVLSTLIGVRQLLSKILEKNNKDTAENTAQTVANETATKGATKGQRAWNVAILGTSKAFKTLKTALISSGVGAVIVALGTVITALTQTQGGLDGLSRGFNIVNAVIQVTIGRLAKVGKAIIDLFQSYNALISFEFKEAAEQAKSSLNNITDAFTGLSDAYSNAIKNAEELTIAQKEQALTTIELEESIARLTKAEEIRQAVADDTTKSFKERERAAQQALDLGLQRSREELQLAKENLRVLELEQKTRKQEGTLTNEDKLERVEVLKALIEAEKNLELTEIEADRTRKELAQDRLERDLDILIDGFDNQKTINERIINNERFTLETRQRLLDETVEKANKSFLEQKDVLEQLSAAGVDINELLKLDATELRKQIRLLEQSEIIEGRTLEVVRERRTVIQDLSEIQDDLNDQVDKQIIKELELKKIKEGVSSEDIQTEIDKKRVELLEREIKKRKQFNKENIEAIEEGNMQKMETLDLELELARIRQKLHEDELKRIQEENDKRKSQTEEFEKAREEYEKSLEKQEQERLEKLKETIKEATDFISDQLEKRSEKAISEIDREIEASQRREEQLVQAARNGNLLADESLALEKERQDKLLAEREKAVRKQQQIELALAAVSAYSAKTQSGDGNALTSTITELTTLLAFADNLQAFEKGGLVEGGEQLVRINERGQEYVISHGAVNKYGTDMLDKINTGEFAQMEVTRSSGGSSSDFNYMMNQALEKVSKEFKSAVSNIPQQRWSMSEITGGLKEEIEKSNQLKSRHYRKGKRLN